MQMQSGWAFLTSEEMGAADRFCIESVGIGVPVLMENAGRAVAELARELPHGLDGKEVCVLVGKGNNGGDGLVAARHLHNWGARVSIVPGFDGPGLGGDPARELSILERMGIRCSEPGRELDGDDLIVDALLGYNSKGDPRGPMAEIISRADESGVPILAVDVPSGLDSTTGEVNAPCIRATDTVSFGFPKVGFLNPQARRFVGRLHVADISFPESLYVERGIKGAFAKGPIVRVW
jgi:ADP-dependent NAD(P)H-hydrate dehydratase / NAD(P)H-hydrate epimerase